MHLNAENTNDVSADLYALSENSNFVICSGAKSILDLSKTNELLETLGITRIGYQTNYMPGFWYEETENKVDNKFDEIHEISSFLKLSENLENKKFRFSQKEITFLLMYIYLLIYCPNKY